MYKSTDPRAKQIKKLTHAVLNSLGESARSEIEALAAGSCGPRGGRLKDEYFTSRKLFPNVDFYSGLVLTAMGFPTSMFTVLFAIGRSAGWIAQWKESVQEKSTHFEAAANV